MCHCKGTRINANGVGRKALSQVDTMQENGHLGRHIP